MFSLTRLFTTRLKALGVSPRLNNVQEDVTDSCVQTKTKIKELWELVKN